MTDNPVRPPLVAAPPALERFVRADRAELLSLLDKLFERIRGLDHVLHVFEPGSPVREKVMAQARALLDRFPDPDVRPPLFGVPVGVKDIFRQQGEAIRCGSLLPPDVFFGPEAEAVTRLRQAGAIIMGRTATTELAYFEPAATCNPHDPERTPGGSSSGSAAGVAAGFFPLALGTQTAGSVIRPASYCGIAGFKPSFGRLPAEGVVYFARSLDQVGIFCATAAEAARAMAALDPEWRPVPAPRKLRLGLPVGPYLEQAAVACLGRLLAELARDSGRSGGRGLPAVPFEVVEVPCLEDIAEITVRHETLMAGEVAREQAACFTRYQRLYRPRTAAIIERGLCVSEAEMERSRASCRELRERLHGLMDEHGIDAFVCPATLGEADMGLSSTGSPAMNLPWSHAGLPALTVPLTEGPSGLPLGLQVVGRFGADEALLAAWA
ncbi:Amidase [Desulfovibrio sp. X2]|uniref:amidase n=1 Tax=Desulfovibrio sp. X2 TaxID=941449 RepID=UPI0003588800|nr:amidase [Desulfovibrio sp. X2]EPR37260.1 Amidase [Desulfovibrio sp. X2]